MAILRAAVARRRLRDHLADMEAGDREVLARRLERDMGGVVGQDEEIGAGRRQLPRVGEEERAQRREVARLPGRQRLVHGDARSG